MYPTVVLRNAQAASKAPSPHAMIYRRFAKPVGKMLTLCVGSYYSLCYAWEWLEKRERALESQKQQRRRSSELPGPV
ncbi:KLTH0D14454p [Lachancea thermotolerans CBS 6340]|uniref:KLTH0D14454p n=1 Tax=Lachancea thermotolerans (strain ATCC 56472 / CBS 6340 / NRRL Y-8284) TaxID=559295 RepID=C5DFE5_LACTC|nr:KLTH0D14454p [Lachancea thermotolerans CBS 6340]CAR22900.1 KLTH0D14454p [Lachancea thermotolerans CBS 6340]